MASSIQYPSGLQELPPGIRILALYLHSANLRAILLNLSDLKKWFRQNLIDIELKLRTMIPV